MLTCNNMKDMQMKFVLMHDRTPLLLDLVAFIFTLQIYLSISSTHSLEISTSPSCFTNIRLHGEKNYYADWNNEKYTPGASESNTGESNGLSSLCYICKGEVLRGHISKKCTIAKRKMDESGINYKVFDGSAQASGQVLTEEENSIFGDQDCSLFSNSQTVIPLMLFIKADDLVL
ncbi:hypothetical protein Tco_1247154 [Tanacetum coccineum]